MSTCASPGGSAAGTLGDVVDVQVDRFGDPDRLNRRQHFRLDEGHRRVGGHHHMHLPMPRVGVSDPFDATARQVHCDDAERAGGARDHR